MADNFNITEGVGTAVRAVEKSSKKTQVVTIDVGGAGAESLPAGTLPISGTVTANLGAIDNAVLDSILAKLSADPATQTTLAAVLAKLSADPATQTTLAALLAKFASGTVIGDVNLGATDNAVLDALAAVLGTTAGAAVITDSIGTIQQYLRGLIVLAIDTTPSAVKPMSPMLEGGLTELVGINEQVDQNDYSGSVGVALGGSYSGEILSIGLYATEDGTGAVQDSAGILFILDADPSINSGDTAMSAAARVTVIGKIAVAAEDWDVDANGGFAFITTQPIPFHALSNLYFVWKHTDATGLNDGAGDDEQLEFNFWWRRES